MHITGKKCLFLIISLFPVVLFSREWTVLIYMAADNGLSPWADSDLVEMETVGSSDDFFILVQIDKPQIGAKRLLVGRGESYTLEDLGILDMCDWQTLYEFLDWGIRNYPSDRYLVILWDHGTGWTSMPKRSFGSDWSSGNELSITNGDFKRAISNTYNSTHKKIDLFAFDACLMQQIEVAYEIKDYAKILLAPQSVDPIAGFPYDKILQEIYANPKITEEDLSKRVVELFVDEYMDIQAVAISAIDLENLKNLRERMEILTNMFLLTSPNGEIINLRENVQTIPDWGTTPNPANDYIDLGDFVRNLYNICPSPNIEKLSSVYNRTIIQSGHWGDEFSRTTGITIWFPDKYLEFKQLFANYCELDWQQSRWQNFLNWFYDEDDIPPSETEISLTHKAANDFQICWDTCDDLARVCYDLVETTDTSVVFIDNCEDSSLWQFNGFSINSSKYHSPSHSFFSGNSSNLENTVETKDNILLENPGLLSIYLSFITEEQTDSIIIEFGDYRDIHYGKSAGWIKRKILLPRGNNRLRIIYRTNGSVNLGGCYIDDIKVYNLRDGRYIARDFPDTSFYIFNKLRGRYLYAVYAKDRYGNCGNLSDFANIYVEDFALPYSNPNPFQSDCEIVLDYPNSLQPNVYIYSISGRRIKRFKFSEINNKKVYWDGRDENNHQVGAGLYFILLKDGSFKKIGKIARQR